MSPVQTRNLAWVSSNLVPDWVRGRDVSLDQHNTLPEVAEYCLKSFESFLKKDDVSLQDFKIVEPGAGAGAFYDLLPKANRIGIDVEPYRKEYINEDYLTWTPPKSKKKFIAIGNPPFGYRGWLALSFMNKSAQFCDYVGFILPMSFQSDGKGSPKHRVNGMTLVHSEKLPNNIFISPQGETIEVNTLWQIWKKGQPIKKPDLSFADEFVELFTVDKRKERLCGMNKIDQTNVFLQRTYYGEPPSLVDDFSKVKYGCGYGIIIKKNKRQVMQILKDTDWIKYSNLAVHNCRHISMYHIKQALLDNELLDAQPRLQTTLC